LFPFGPPESESDGPALWIDSDSGTFSTLTIEFPGAVFLATKTYSINYVRRVGEDYYTGTMTVTIGAANVDTATFSLPGNAPGYYSFSPISTALADFPGGTPTSVQISLTRTVASYAVRHEKLPANISYYMDSIRINAARSTMTNFSGPFNAEGGAVAVELPTFRRWDELFYSGGIPYPSPFSVISNVEGKRVIENSKGLSAFGHCDFLGEPVDPLLTDAVVGVPGSGALSSASLDDLCGGVVLCIRTSLTNTAGRDGWWQAFWATESETDSQLWSRREAEYSPTTKLNAQQEFKAISLVSHNPDHFRAGVAALRSAGQRINKFGGALVKTGIGAPLGGSLQFAGNAANQIFGSLL